mgnify:CR=1 FL=1
MRSVDPLTLKLHKKENWINLITFNNFSLDFQRISYLNKIVNFYFTPNNNFLSNLKSIELKKKICIQADVTNFEFFYNGKHTLFFDEFLFMKKNNSSFFFSTFFEKNFKIRTFDFFLPSRNFYKKIITSHFFEKQYKKKLLFFYKKKNELFIKNFFSASIFFHKNISFEKFLSNYENIFNRMQHNGSMYLYIHLMFSTFFFYKALMEIFLQNTLHKQVIIQPKFFFVKYLGMQYRKFFSSFVNTSVFSDDVVLSKKKKKRMKANKGLFTELLMSLGLALVYNQPELFLKGIINYLNISTSHSLFYQYLEAIFASLGCEHYRNIRLTFSGRFLVSRTMRAQRTNVFAGHAISVQNYSKQIYYGIGTAKTFAGSINVRLWWI